MNDKIQKWLDALREANNAYAAAYSEPLPKSLRPATDEDMDRYGQIVWRPEWQDCKWTVIGMELSMHIGTDGFFVESKE